MGGWGGDGMRVVASACIHTDNHACTPVYARVHTHLRREQAADNTLKGDVIPFRHDNQMHEATQAWTNSLPAAARRGLTAEPTRVFHLKLRGWPSVDSLA